MELSAASFAYPQHDGSVRAELARRIIAGDGIPEGFLLSTCLRVEVVVPGPGHLLHDALDHLFGEVAESVDPQIRTGEPAVAHLYRIAAGLESPILGEQEIFTQFRQALVEAEEEGRVQGVFARLLEGAIAAGRQAREVLPASPHNSMAAVAAQAVGTSERVAVLGSGIMASAVVDGLLLLPAPPSITVVARNPEKVASRTGVEVLPFDEATSVLAEYPAVISATSAKRRLVDDQEMAATFARRASPLLLIDMAMPPDFPPPLSAGITYLDIDDLARMADRRSRSEEADQLIESAAAGAYRQFRDHHEIGPLITALMTRSDEVVDQTVQRFQGRLADPEHGAVMRQAVHTAVRTLIAGPVSYLKQGERSPEAIDVIADAFGVDE